MGPDHNDNKEAEMINLGAQIAAERERRQRAEAELAEAKRCLGELADTREWAVRTRLTILRGRHQRLQEAYQVATPEERHSLRERVIDALDRMAELDREIAPDRGGD